ncbi:hypothetical protein O7600_19530 [Micromonospora sp. WMMA1998]|uniref:hypothetical protein n=1 Tax=Micromonospora sp. WMMA1998 TaxID=3015167 RepID=UPI00248D0208|nr:hypothetical protein [Micromonospora sp. WMMA1998]WBC13332.1 hypothetical protein O7600_19530 [Micromonospora sp. WMMA1998]
MTYRQLFDDLIGETPVSTVDVDRVIGGQRRARRLRIGAGTTAVAAVVAAVLVGTTSLTGKPHSGPAPAVTRSPAPVVSTVPGTAEDVARLKAAARTAIERAVPDLVWITMPGSTDSVDRNPVWVEVGPPTRSNRDFYRLPLVNFRVDRKGVSVNIDIDRDGAAVWQKRTPCPTRGVAAENCVVSTGSSGERARVRRDVISFGPKWDHPYDRPVPGEGQTAEVLRPDGSLVTVRTYGLAKGVTGETLTRIARDPALKLSDRPPAGAGPSAARRDGSDWFHTVEAPVQTALGSALADVSTTGRIHFWLNTGSADPEPRMWGLGFVIDRGGLAGDGEAVVERGTVELSCASLGKLWNNPHREHSHDGDCVQTTRPDGNRQVTVVSRVKGVVTYMAFVQRPDRTFTEVRLNNRPERNAGRTPRSAWAYGVKPGGATPPLTLDQVVALAAHPDLLGVLP